MDTLLHGVLGAVACSRTGLPGGRRGPVDERGRRQLADWTLWAALGFGLFPDIASLGIHFATDLFTGNGVRWHGIPDFVFLLYNLTHSLLGIAIGYALLVAWKRSLWLPALAWPLHVLVDVPTPRRRAVHHALVRPFFRCRVHRLELVDLSGVFYGGRIAAGVLWLLVIVLRLSWRKPT